MRKNTGKTQILSIISFLQPSVGIPSENCNFLLRQFFNARRAATGFG